MNQADLISEDKRVSIWDLLWAITSKKNWYSKVFDNLILQTWKSEIEREFADSDYLGSTLDLFRMAIKMLQATAQGSNLNHQTCTWKDNDFCEICTDKAKQLILSNPTEYGYEPDDPDILGMDDDNVEYIFREGTGEYDFCTHPVCRCRGPDSELEDYLIYLSSGLLSDSLRKTLKETINQMMIKLPTDWHPGSNQQVRDIIHPSLYPYIRGISLLNDGRAESEVSEQFRYQWLPSEIKVDCDGKVNFESYINNLPSSFPILTTHLSTVIENLIPLFEKVIHQKLIGRNLQIIVKIGSTHLDKSKPCFPGGSWHIEGTPQEHIVATGLHYLKVEGITESFLEFRKPVILNHIKLRYPQDNAKYTTYHYGIEPDSHSEGEMNRYLGLIKCTEGATVVFPNTLQHHVKDFELDSGSEEGMRIILAFFLIDPEQRIISTADIPHQQQTIVEEVDVKLRNKMTFTRQQAEFYRERLMFHRKFIVDQLNKEVFERPFSLCEH